MRNEKSMWRKGLMAVLLMFSVSVDGNESDKKSSIERLQAALDILKGLRKEMPNDMEFRYSEFCIRRTLKLALKVRGIDTDADSRDRSREDRRDCCNRW